MSRLLMPKATAVWLVENTALTFDQIAAFCELHPLQVKGVADGDVDIGIKGLDPVANGQLTRQEITRGETDPNYRVQMAKTAYDMPDVKARRRPRYTPVSKRQERPDAIYWLVRNHPELTDPQISKLVGTTKATIEAIRDRTHWNASNIKPVDPVSLGLCSQIELDEAVKKAAVRLARENSRNAPAGETLKPIDQSMTLRPAASQIPQAATEEKSLDADSVFAKLKGTGERADR